MSNGVRWWWIAYTDRSLPKGEQSRGVNVVQAATWDGALAFARSIGIAPAPCGPRGDFEALGGPVDPAAGDPPDASRDRLLSDARAREVAVKWTGDVATAEDIERAYLDDGAREGEPLFRRPP